MQLLELEERLVELETRVAFQEQAISDLSDAILAQQTAIEQARQKMVGLVGRMDSLEQSGGENANPEPPPPHY